MGAGLGAKSRKHMVAGASAVCCKENLHSSSNCLLPEIMEMDQKMIDKASSYSRIVQHYSIRELVFFFCYAFDTFSCCLTFKIKKLSFFYNVEITWIFLGETPQHCS